MNLKSFSTWSVVALLVAAAACSKTNPARPTDLNATAETASVTDAVSGITLTSPQLFTPNDGATFKNVEQPVTLTVKNAATTGATALTYTFEVATDSSFATKAYSKDGVAEGSGTTALKIDRLTPDKTYYWRARSSSGSLAGPFTKARSFVIGPEVILQAPVATSPANGATSSGIMPTLTVANVARTGPAGPIEYRFEVSESSSFGSLVAAVTVRETANQTSSQITAKLTTNATYFWRVQASDPSNAVTSPYSTTFSFKYVPFDLSQATILNNPQDLANWDQSTRITMIQFTPGAILVDFDKRTGPGRWPESGFGTGGIQYTLGMCLNIREHWYCSAAIQFWDGRELEASGLPSEIAINWFYDARWGAMQGYQPSQGEIVGLFVAQGNLRDSGKTSVKERSDVVLIPFGGNNSYSALNGLSGLLRSR